MQRLESEVNDHLQNLEESLKALSEVVLSTKGSTSSHAFEQNFSQSQYEESDSSCMNILLLSMKLEFPCYARDDSME